MKELQAGIMYQVAGYKSELHVGIEFLGEKLPM
jgi:hypothetical protein